ncbi:MAG: hypothetical protein A2Y12_09665 [Planctomycetes bacterium GWF2_42_9]|nr:MAG: hypothetical protein A2Y12_09665 [Planctomycetes bacterium GWF2_42_9]
MKSFIKYSSIILFLGFLLWQVPVVFASHSDQQYFINVDYYDQVIYASKFGYTTYRKPEIKQFFQKCKQMGVDGVLWRVSVLGQVAYQSKTATIFPGNMDCNSLQGQYLEMARILQDFDPLDVAVKEAKANGIKIFAWMTISDEGGIKANGFEKYCESRFITENPHCALLDKTGNAMVGTLCYSEPAVCKQKLAEIAELCSYDFDGIYLCTRTHAFYRNTDKGDDYGYNMPVIQEYKRLYGKDIQKEPFDANLWHQIRAEGFTKFLKNASHIVHKSGKELWLGIKTAENEKYGWPYGNAVLPWKSWVKDGYIDAIIAGHNFVPPEAIARGTKEFKSVAKSNQRILFWIQLFNYQTAKRTDLDVLEKMIKAIDESGANGGSMHEVAGLEEDMTGYWDPVSEFVQKNWRKGIDAIQK